MHDHKYAEYKDTPGMLNKEVQDYHLILKIVQQQNKIKVLKSSWKHISIFGVIWVAEFKRETTCPSERWKKFRTVEHSMDFHSGSAKSYLTQVFNYDTSGKLMASYIP